MSTVFEFLTNEIGDLVDFDVADMKPSTMLLEIGLDSLDYVSLQVSVKKAYGFELNFDDFSSGKIKTLEEFCDYIENRTVTA
ncbi:acyl carrier protein [Azoarcus sp. TTM-91]|uniref:Acyl carrier protein n=1 Tax=Azoarcus indigens TaxID=29545 RepID=A0A4R6DYN8_9RHOO|nr:MULTISPECIES: acyl carrier protein [Azoarcus]NMG34453.1 acyl carrier protein [Azoarcus sp. TTM-91]NMG65193.1 acyl carrier protein [Azoarcus indigens]TDN49548.1 acyl carrier protein [Azoarcus indigens]